MNLWRRISKRWRYRRLADLLEKWMIEDEEMKSTDPDIQSTSNDYLKLADEAADSDGDNCHDLIRRMEQALRELVINGDTYRAYASSVLAAVQEERDQARAELKHAIQQAEIRNGFYTAMEKDFEIKNMALAEARSEVERLKALLVEIKNMALAEARSEVERLKALLAYWKKVARGTEDEDSVG